VLAGQQRKLSPKDDFLNDVLDLLGEGPTAKPGSDAPAYLA
jgi:hypothetical protein